MSHRAVLQCRRFSFQQLEGGQLGLTMEDFQVALAPLLTGIQDIRKRSQNVQTHMSQKLASAVNFIEKIDAQQKQSMEQIAGVQSTVQKQGEIQKFQKQREETLEDVLRRLQALEAGKGDSAVWRPLQGEQRGEIASPHNGGLEGRSPRKRSTGQGQGSSEASGRIHRHASRICAG